MSSSSTPSGFARIQESRLQSRPSTAGPLLRGGIRARQVCAVRQVARGDRLRDSLAVTAGARCPHTSRGRLFKQTRFESEEDALSPRYSYRRLFIPEKGGTCHVLFLREYFRRYDG